MAMTTLGTCTDRSRRGDAPGIGETTPMDWLRGRCDAAGERDGICLVMRR